MLSIADQRLSISLPGADLGPGRSFFVALRLGRELGSAVIPFGQDFEGSTVFLPFQADRLYLVRLNEDAEQVFERRWENWKWNDRNPPPNDIKWDAKSLALSLPASGLPAKLSLAIYVKDFREGKTWGRLI